MKAAKQTSSPNEIKNPLGIISRRKSEIKGGRCRIDFIFRGNIASSIAVLILTFRSFKNDIRRFRPPPHSGAPGAPSVASVK